MKQDKKLKVSIFMGGRSTEKEISLETARHVYNHLDTSKYTLIPIFVNPKMRLWRIPESLLWLNTCSDFENKLDEAEQVTYERLPEETDFAFLTTHGKYGEDCLPALLHLLKIPNNSCGILGGAINMDKFLQRKLLIADGLNVPSTIGIRQGNENYQCVHLSPEQFAIESTLSRAKLWTGLTKSLNQPLVIKPSREGCSLAINKVNSSNELQKALAEAFQYDNLVIAEEFLEGKEITTTVLGNEEPFALTPTETPSKGDYLTVEEKFLPGDAQMITPPELPKDIVEKIKADCVKAFRTMELKVLSRIDGFWCPTKPEDSRFIILEPNSPPGMTPSTCIFHPAAEEGWSQGNFFDKVIEFGLHA